MAGTLLVVSALACPFGQVETGGICCWPGQTSLDSGACIGEPSCPAPLVSVRDGCLPPRPQLEPEVHPAPATPGRLEPQSAPIRAPLQSPTSAPESDDSPRRPLPEGTELSLGIGAIQFTSDGTTATFELFEALEGTKYLATARGPLRPRLVDHWSEATYSLTGTIDGQIEYAPEQPLSWSYKGTFVLRRGTRKLGTFKAEIDGTAEVGDRTMYRLHHRVLQPLWAKVIDELAYRIDMDLIGKPPPTSGAPANAVTALSLAQADEQAGFEARKRGRIAGTLLLIGGVLAASASPVPYAGSNSIIENIKDGSRCSGFRGQSYLDLDSCWRLGVNEASALRTLSLALGMVGASSVIAGIVLAAASADPPIPSGFSLALGPSGALLNYALTWP